MADEVVEVGDFDEMAEALMARPRAMSHLLLASLAVALVSSLLWAALSQVDLTVKAPGIVRPSGDVARVDAQVGGAVREALVREGDAVAEGAVLLRLDLALQEAEQQRRATVLGSQKTQRDNAVRSRASLEELQALEERAREGAVRQAEERQRVEEQRARVREEKARGEVRFAALEVEHARTTEDLKKKMVDAQIGSREDWQQAVRARQLTEERHAKAVQEEKSVDRAEAALAAREIERLKADGEARRKAGEREREGLKAELDRLDGEIARQQQEVEAFSAELAKAEVRAPVSGIVASIAVLRSGEVVKAGQEVARIVPRGAPLLVEALVANADIGFLKPGMPAKFRFHAFSHHTYGALTGSVTWIAPDSATVELPGGVRAAAYKVRLSLDSTEVKQGTRTGRVEVGMEADVDVVSSRESLLALAWRKVREQFSP